MAEEGKAGGPGARSRRKKLMQSDVPAYTARDALRVAEALRDQYGKRAASPLMVAKALDMSPTSSAFRMITGASVAYGLTDAAAQADRIDLTDLGRRAVAPLKQGDDVAAFREAILKPRVVREFLERYSGSRVPGRAIALNVLEDMGVPSDSTERALDMALSNARDANFIEVVRGAEYVSLNKAPSIEMPVFESDDAIAQLDVDDVEPNVPANTTTPPVDQQTTSTPPPLAENNRVFISHGKNRDIVAQLKEVLTFGGFEPVVSVENETFAKSVPDKVMDDLRSCGAGIVHVGAERSVMDAEGNKYAMLNNNVLIEIGAALALYGRRIILLVEEGTELPSNLQGLYQARYTGGKLDYEATMKLLRTFNEFRKAEKA